MSYIGNTPGVSSQRVVLEEVVSGSPKSAFVPQSGYIIGYVDVLVNGVEIDSTDFSAPDGVTVTLATAAAVGDTVKVKTWLPRGLSDGYLKTEADAKFVDVTGDTMTGELVAPSVKVKAAGGARALITSTSNGVQNNDDVGGINWRLNSGAGTLLANIYYKGNPDATSSGAGKLWFGARANDGGTTTIDHMSLDTSGNLALASGNLVLANGKGIDFSASSNAAGMTSEVFDDYETGTWTPSFTALNNDMSITYTTQFGSYVKIGKLVFAKGYILINTISNRGSGGLALAGLPFAVTEEVSLNFADNNALTNYYSASLTQIYGYGAAGTGVMHFRAAGGSNSLFRPIGNAALQAGYLLFNVTYMS